MNCGECLGEDRPYVAREHLKKFTDHIEYITKSIIDPFTTGTVDEWINRKLTSLQTTVDLTEPLKKRF